MGNQSSYGAVGESSPTLPDVVDIITDSQKDKDNALEDVTVKDVLEGLLRLPGNNTCAKTKLRDEKTKNLLFEDSDNAAVAFGYHGSSPDIAYASLKTMVTCQNKKCGKCFSLDQAKKIFKSCRSCYTYYCGRACRHDDWEHHKSGCPYSLAHRTCKQVIKRVNTDANIQYQMSRLARRGYLCSGRGCVLLGFQTVYAAHTFLANGLNLIHLPPAFASLKELQDSKMFGDILPSLVDACKTYNPDVKYVVHIGVDVTSLPLSVTVPRRSDAVVQQCAVLRLSDVCQYPRERLADTTPLIVTAVYGLPVRTDAQTRTAREAWFIDIQRTLRGRGVNLRHQFRDVYDRLINFVADAKYFSPEIFYPVDDRTGNRFMCVIMPESEPEIEWLHNPQLFQNDEVSDELSLLISSNCLVAKESM